MVHPAVAGVEDARRLANHDLQERGQTGHGKVLQRPIPVIVVVGAEGIGASEELLVGVSVQRHSHVMLGGLPCFHLHFVGFAGVADVSVASKG